MLFWSGERFGVGREFIEEGWVCTGVFGFRRIQVFGSFFTLLIHCFIARCASPAFLLYFTFRDFSAFFSLR